MRNQDNTCFRAKLNNRTLEDYISKYEHWQEIQNQHIDEAFQAYLVNSFLSVMARDEVSFVLNLIEKGGIFGVAVEAHEKWECLEHLKAGYTLTDLNNGKAWSDNIGKAHAEARWKEYNLYQFLYKKLFKKDAPSLKAFVLVIPLSELIADKWISAGTFEDRIKGFGKYEPEVRGGDCSEKELEKVTTFFENVGYSYKDKNRIIESTKFYLTRNNFYHE